MKKVILNREKVSQNDYLLIEEITSLPKSNTKKVIVTTPQWLENKKTLKVKKNIGIKLNSDESINLIKNDINLFKIIQFNYLTFKD